MGSTSTVAAMNKFLFSALFLASAASIFASAFQFEVGDEMGWRKPTQKDQETYNEWAAQNRFHIGDTLHFNYAKDSVLVVSAADYETCNTSNPIAKFEDEKTVYEFDRPGLFYFISGQPGHCKSGQRLIVRVMHPSQVSAPELAPSPAPAPAEDSGGDSDDSGFLPKVSSGFPDSVVSYFVTAFAGLFWAFV
ncbi:hypothetical protein C2S52_013390 [Perilla frutescens var. hirtella]|nr:hypothetical protein C2S52_013390 [Perilla frutescens var. hirtella]